MGIAFAEAEINGVKFRALVDTGFNGGDVLVRREIAKNLGGLQVIGRTKRKTADNRVVELDVSYARLRLYGEEGYVIVEIIDDSPVDVLIGVRALEALGFIIDPATGTLRKIGLIAV
ncbi:clan AA aspartic protease [Vulcanisaeta distributa]|uniref:clan AA aspartic protease n=1 Tax=Vulcanisaeta distributa TaxID=164451 RepID=UPI001FB56233|nr:clan AA aspartic protease [Vulcanisaeta distributa]